MMVSLFLSCSLKESQQVQTFYISNPLLTMTLKSQQHKYNSIYLLETNRISIIVKNIDLKRQK